MEDAHFVLRDGPYGDVLGVLDGCGGANASNFASMAFQRALAPPCELEPGKALEGAFDKVERLVIQAATAKNWADATTATVCAVAEKRVDVAWVGDSRAVLATVDWAKPGARVRAAALTADHRPDDPLEKARIKALGGGCGRSEKEAFATPKQQLRASVVGAHVVFNVNRKSAHRVFPGGIAVTRALGALPLKRATPRLVIPTPSVAGRNLTGSEAFLIVACDGVWDVFSDQQACDFVKAALAKGARGDAAELLVKEAYAKGSTDNISACVLEFKPPAPLDAHSQSAVDRVDRYFAAGLDGEPEAKTG